MSETRRQFLLQLAEAAAYGAALAGLPACKRAGGPGQGAPASSDGALVWHKGVCRFCGTGCGVLVGVERGRVVGVQGDVKNPVNRGLLCVKGYATPLILYGADRLTVPQVRHRKGGPLVRASWDEALDLVAHQINEALAAAGPGAIGLYLSGQSTIPEGYAALKWMKAGLSSNNLEANARLCMASAVSGHMTTFGSDEPAGCYEDLDEADVLVLWGANMAEMHPVLWSRITDRKARQPFVKVVDIAVRRTRTTEQADLFLPILPQGDLALANAVAHCLVRDGKIDRAFLAAHVAFKAGRTGLGYGLEDRFSFKDEPRPITFEEYAAFLADYAPDKVAALAGVAPAQIEELARLYGDPHTRVVSLWTMGVNQHTRGTWMNNLLHNLHLLTGKIGRPGCTSLSLTGQPSACGTVREVGVACNRLPADMVTDNPEHVKKAAEIWRVPADKIPTTPGYDAIEMFRALDRGDLRFLWIQCTNPMQSLPNAKRYREAMSKPGRFIVVSDVYPTETTRLADVVLPSAMWVEKEGYYGNTERRTQHWHKMVEPPGEARTDLWQIVEVARRTGCAHLFDFPETRDKGISLEQALYEEYRRFTLGTGKDVASHEELVATRGLRWPVVRGRETRRRYVEGEDPYVQPGEGIRFYKNTKEDGRAIIWARPYEPPPEVPDRDYPFWLCTGRVLEHWHTGSLTRRVPQLHRAVPRAFVEIHPEDAEALGIADGARTRLVSRRGSIVLTASVSGRSVPRRGLVFVPFFDEAVLVNLLTLDATCPISREPDYKKCAVRLERA
ncbi:MAG: molybdopterin-dependent oxidoreductase [Myxococcales bacterium]|nr:molybdopterin-dependent oxidoreductase [Myxococcota bacterium]MDW8282262.1 molybdopterin-dependent oxidoreductase [Myxococcales bacterium]